MKLIVFAHPVEAQVALQKLEAKEVEPNLWRIEGGAILITGGGMVAAAAAVARYASGFSHIDNIGSAGS